MMMPSASQSTASPRDSRLATTLLLDPWTMTAVSTLPRVLGDFEEDAFGVVEVAEALAAGVGNPERHGDRRRNQGNSRGAEPLAKGVQVVDLEGEMAQSGRVRETVGRQRLALRGARLVQRRSAPPPRSLA